MINEYENDFVYIKIFKILKNKSNVKLFFLIENNLLYKKEINDDVSFFLFKRICVSQSMIKNILIMIHNSANDYAKFDRIYDKLMNAWFIHDFLKQSSDYLKHCFKCRINRARKHKFYDSIQSIFSSSISFYSIIIDFKLIISISHTNMNNIMSVIDKFNKRIIIIFVKNTWNAKQWVNALLKKLNFTDWDLLKVIIFDRDQKFLFDLWFALFIRFDVKFLYFTTYHSQIDESFERINQTLKIGFRYHIQILASHENWLSTINLCNDFSITKLHQSKSHLMRFVMNLHFFKVQIYCKYQASKLFIIIDL